MPGAITVKHKVQDWVFAVGCFVLAVGLLPALSGHISTPAWSAALTATVLAIFGLTYLSMKFYWAFAMASVQAVLWIVVLSKVI